MIWIYTSETAFIYINSSDYQKSLKSRHYSRSPDEETVAQSGLVTSSRPHSSVAELKLRSNFPVLSLKTPCLFFPGYFCSILELKRWSEEVLSWKITFVEWFIVLKVHSYQRFNKWSFPPAQIQHSIIFFCKFLFGRKRNFFFSPHPAINLKVMHGGTEQKCPGGSALAWKGNHQSVAGHQNSGSHTWDVLCGHHVICSLQRLLPVSLEAPSPLVAVDSASPTMTQMGSSCSEPRSTPAQGHDSLPTHLQNITPLPHSPYHLEHSLRIGTCCHFFHLKSPSIDPTSPSSYHSISLLPFIENPGDVFPELKSNEAQTLRFWLSKSSTLWTN